MEFHDLTYFFTYAPGLKVHVTAFTACSTARCPLPELLGLMPETDKLDIGSRALA